MKVPAFRPLLYRHADRLTMLVMSLLALGITLGITLTAWKFANNAIELETRRHFELRVMQIHEAIRARMLDCRQLLRRSTELFDASSSVNRSDWHAYVASLRLENGCPGIQGLGYVERVLDSQRQAHTARVRAGGYPGYTMWPEGDRAEYAPVVYMEPANERNLRWLGLDMAFDPTSRRALERAMDTGLVTLTPKLRLDPQIDADMQTEFAMFLPVYRNGVALDNVSQRRLATQGYVYAVFRANNLMRSILGVVDDARLQIFDGAETTDAQLLYDNLPGVRQTAPTAGSVYAAEWHTPVIDRVWTVRAASLPVFEAAVDRSRANLALAVGLVISFMLTALVGRLLTQQAHARHMTTELRESREVLGLALDGSNLALFDSNPQTGVVRMSDRWNALLGYPAEAVQTTAHELEALVHPDDLPHLRGMLSDVLDGKTVFYDIEHRVRHREGYWIWIRSRARVVERDDQGRAVRLTGTNSDITERKQMQRMKDEFIATVNHELRTPLTALIGSLALLKEESGPLSPTATTFLDMADKNADRLASLVNDILEIEKIEAGMVELKMARMSLGPFIEQALAMNAGYAEQHGTRYQLVSPLPTVEIMADRDRLLQVLTNLLSNAAKYSPSGEIVSVHVERLDNQVKISVTDRGSGVPDEFRSRIFGKFAQADTSDSTKKGGTGLGLAISKALVEAMNGRIGYESAAGAGATFYIVLPVA